MSLPYLMFSDKSGKFYKHPHLRMAGASLNLFRQVDKTELMRLPKGSSLFYLPYRAPVGFNPKTREFEPVFEFEGKEVFALGAFLPPAYLRFCNPANIKVKNQKLPLWAYTACGVSGKDVYVSARRIDRRVRQSPGFYNSKAIKAGAKEFLKKYPGNRLYKHLAHCALNYNCLAAKNLFLKRWEGPLPTSQFCNARCIGCLSYQESDCVASHSRINFLPTVKEISEVAYNHLNVAKEAIISFGQGCEGEPLLCAGNIAEAISQIRKHTSRGTINMNTNASMPKKIELLCRAGIDSFRMSLNSPIEKFYNLYFRPRNYKFSDVLRSIETAKKYNKFVSINLFIFPGFSDSEGQIAALSKFIKATGIDMIQLRNLNIDPDYFCESVGSGNFSPRGIPFLIKTIQHEFPYLKLGYFNLPKEHFKSFKNMV